MWQLALSASVISCVVTFYIVPLLLKIARKIGAIDAPDGHIKTHTQATPYLGGLAVYIGFITALALTFPFVNNFFLFLVGCTLLLFVGLIDDLTPLSPLQKIVGQSVAVICFLKAGFYLKEGFFHHLWGIPISFLWILTVINAFNLVDVMDGLTTTVTFYATLFFMIYAYNSGSSTVFLLLACFLGTLPAFFWYNKPQARIYLGDSGALFIGGFMGALPFLLEWRLFSHIGFIAPVLILAIPLIELTSLIIIRSYLHIPFYRGSPHHFSLYLKRKKWSVVQVLLFISCISMLFGGIALGVAFGQISLGKLGFLLSISLIVWYMFIFSTFYAQK